MPVVEKVKLRRPLLVTGAAEPTAVDPGHPVEAVVVAVPCALPQKCDHLTHAIIDDDPRQHHRRRELCHPVIPRCAERRPAGADQPGVAAGPNPHPTAAGMTLTICLLRSAIILLVKNRVIGSARTAGPRDSNSTRWLIRAPPGIASMMNR
jgi:hypothetical protein